MPIRLDVDAAERGSALYAAVQRCPAFEVHVRRLAVGDYRVAGKFVVERKSLPDFVRSLVDGRLFPQGARLSREPRAALLVERFGAGPIPNVHPHAILGAVVSLAVIWRVPVIWTFNVRESVVVLRALADQTARRETIPLRRFDFKPRRLQSRRLYFLQSLPGIGPALAQRLLERFGSPARVVAAAPAELTAVRGIGPAKAAAIRALLDSAGEAGA